jgi:hypothetical protein
MSEEPGPSGHTFRGLCLSYTPLPASDKRDVVRLRTERSGLLIKFSLET